MIRIDESTNLGVALSTDANGRYAKLDPYAGAQLALAEAYRNVAASGATPLAVTNCLNFGSPEDPDVMWQFAEATRGLADGCLDARHPGHRRQRQLLQPDRRRRRSCPTPGRRRARRHRRRHAPHRQGLRGRRATSSTCSARRATSSAAPSGRTSCTVTSAGCRRGSTSRPSARSASCSSSASRDGILTAASDLSEGGLAQALVEMALHGGRGVSVELPHGADPFVQLFSESTARAVVTVRAGRRAERCASGATPLRVRATRLGVVTEARRRHARSRSPASSRVPLAELREAHEATFPRLFA